MILAALLVTVIATEYATTMRMRSRRKPTPLERLEKAAVE